jgi:hypothetical protein
VPISFAPATSPRRQAVILGNRFVILVSHQQIMDSTWQGDIQRLAGIKDFMIAKFILPPALGLTGAKTDKVCCALTVILELKMVNL